MRKNKSETSTLATIITAINCRGVLFVQNMGNNTLAIFFGKSLNPSMEIYEVIIGLYKFLSPITPKT